MVEPRLSILEDFLECGRLSFKGYNPEVEVKKEINTNIFSTDDF